MIFRFVESEAKRLREKYPVRTIEDVETLARREYGIVPTRTPLALPCNKVLEYGGVPHIFYDGPNTLAALSNLGHEIGHVAGGHLRMNSFIAPVFYHIRDMIFEPLADRFSSTLLGLSKAEHDGIHSGQSIRFGRQWQDVLTPRVIDEERERLRVLGIEEAFPWDDFYVRIGDLKRNAS